MFKKIINLDVKNLVMGLIRRENKYFVVKKEVPMIRKLLTVLKIK